MSTESSTGTISVEIHYFAAAAEARLTVFETDRRLAERARTLKLELAADYLVMAAWLAYLKSALLLPRDPEGLEWLVTQLLESLDAGRFASVPDSD